MQQIKNKITIQPSTSRLSQTTMKANAINDDAKTMNEFREKIVSDKYYCFGWCYTWNADPGCLEDDASIEEFRKEIENNAICEITDPEDRETALQQLDADTYDGPVYRAGGVTFIAN